MLILLLGLLAAVAAGSNSDNQDSFKNQFRSSGHGGKHKDKHESFSADHCTDPRTMKKHAAYTEWADAYSCTRHRCQPGGRNLAIYTVGCKRVEAPESAIECEEVVEDTNMQFPFCCTRLRCLVVVRGEVWTRVLGQPWEVLPAAPWSHMYKMKKPPPADSTFLSKTPDQGPVYELAESDTEQVGHDKVLRATKKANTDFSEAPTPAEKAALPPPDIVIALSTNDIPKEAAHTKNYDKPRHSKRRRASAEAPANYFEEDAEKGKHADLKNQEVEELPSSTEKPQEPLEEDNEKFFNNNENPSTEKSSHKSHKTHDQVSWTEIPQNQWNEPKEGADIDNSRSNDHNTNYQTKEPQQLQYSEPKHESLQIPVKIAGDKPSNLQALVDAIGSRMRDIETVVQKMSDKVHHAKPPGTENSNEKRMSAEREVSHHEVLHKRTKESKRQSAEEDNSNYKRFTELKDRTSKYLHTNADITTENPLFIEETNLTGYFSDASNSILRRNNQPKEPQMYMAPVETRRKPAPQHITVPTNAEEIEKKRKKHAHKKRKGKGRSHKKHTRSKDDKRKHFNRLSSGESEKNAVSLDDTSEAMQ